MRGAEAVVRFLEEALGDHVFGLPGSTMVPLMHALKDRDLTFVPSVHEASAVAMADGYARVKGPTAALLYMLPGTANGLGNLYNAYRDESPLLVLASQQVARARTREGSVGESDTTRLVEPFTSYSWEVRSGQQLIPTLQRAHASSLGPPGGPSFVALTEDVLVDELDRPKVLPHRSAAPGPPPDLAILMERLTTAERPVVIAGGQVRRSGGSADLERLAAALELPVFLEPFWNDRLAIAPSHRCYLGPFTERSRMVREADFVLAVGCRLLNEVHPLAEPWFAENAFVAHVNADGRKLNQTLLAGWSVACSPGLLLRALVAAGPGEDLESGLRDRRAARLREARERREKRELTPIAQAGAAVAEMLDDAWIVDESVSGNFPLASAARSDHGEHFISTTGGSLGWGPGAAVGVALATKEPVICYLGDGAFFFSLQALWPAQAMNLPITYVVLENRGFGSTRYFEERYVADHVQDSAPGYIGSDFGPTGPSIVSLARGFGMPAEALASVDELPARLRDRVSRSQGPSLYVVPVGS